MSKTRQIGTASLDADNGSSPHRADRKALPQALGIGHMFRRLRRKTTMRSKNLGWAGAAVGALLAISAPAMAQMSSRGSVIQQCQGSVPAEQRVKACTAVLGGAGLAPRDAAFGHYFRGFAERDLHQDDAALADFEAAIRFDVDLWPAYWMRAELLEPRRDYVKAARDWTEVIQHNARMASAYFRRGADLDWQGRAADALADFSKAIELVGPKDNVARFYMDRAGAFEGDHQLDKALADYNESISRDNRNHVAYVGRGRVELLRGDYAAAIADLGKAVDIDRTDGYAVLWLYLAEARAGQSAATQLRQRTGQMDLNAWPGPILRVLLGDAKPEQVEPPQRPETWPAEIRKAGAQCELSYYLGEVRLLQHQDAKAAALFQATIATDMKEYIEYRAAAYELQRLGR
jgi:lipoprotein NlpI